MTLKSFTLFLFLSMPVIMLAQIPTGYYSNAEGKTGVALKQALHEIIDDHTEKSYNNLRDYILRESDEDPNNSNNVILLYKGISQAKSTFGGGADDWNREHVWAKSHGGFDNDPPAGTDAHHIRPTDASFNSSRGNKDFDEGGTYHSEATECRSTSTSWEPRDAVKGDVARMMFYMVVRYEGDVSGEPDLELVDYIPTSGPNFGKLSTLVKWHLNDPVDDFERTRNEVVYSYQNNRNPFIDHPEYVCEIWGDYCPTNSSRQLNITELEAFKLFPNPANDRLNMTYTLSKAANVDILIYDARGQLTAQVKAGHQAAGRQQYNWNIPARLANGTYWIEIKSAQQASQRCNFLLTR